MASSHAVPAHYVTSYSELECTEQVIDYCKYDANVSLFSQLGPDDEWAKSRISHELARRLQSNHECMGYGNERTTVAQHYERIFGHFPPAQVGFYCILARILSPNEIMSVDCERTLFERLKTKKRQEEEGPIGYPGDHTVVLRTRYPDPRQKYGIQYIVDDYDNVVKKFYACCKQPVVDEDKDEKHGCWHYSVDPLLGGQFQKYLAWFSMEGKTEDMWRMLATSTSNEPPIAFFIKNVVPGAMFLHVEKYKKLDQQIRDHLDQHIQNFVFLFYKIRNHMIETGSSTRNYAHRFSNLDFVKDFCRMLFEYNRPFYSQCIADQEEPRTPEQWNAYIDNVVLGLPIARKYFQLRAPKELTLPSGMKVPNPAVTGYNKTEVDAYIAALDDADEKDMVTNLGTAYFITQPLPLASKLLAKYAPDLSKLEKLLLKLDSYVIPFWKAYRKLKRDPENNLKTRKRELEAIEAARMAIYKDAPDYAVEDDKFLGEFYFEDVNNALTREEIMLRLQTLLEKYGRVDQANVVRRDLEKRQRKEKDEDRRKEEKEERLKEEKARRRKEKAKRQAEEEEKARRREEKAEEEEKELRRRQKEEEEEKAREKAKRQAEEEEKELSKRQEEGKTSKMVNVIVETSRKDLVTVLLARSPSTQPILDALKKIDRKNWRAWQVPRLINAFQQNTAKFTPKNLGLMLQANDKEDIGVCVARFFLLSEIIDAITTNGDLADHVADFVGKKLKYVWARRASYNIQRDALLTELNKSWTESVDTRNARVTQLLQIVPRDFEKYQSQIPLIEQLCVHTYENYDIAAQLEDDIRKAIMAIKD
jgi:hypothetical protein